MGRDAEQASRHESSPRPISIPGLHTGLGDSEPRPDGRLRDRRRREAGRLDCIDPGADRRCRLRFRCAVQHHRRRRQGLRRARRLSGVVALAHRCRRVASHGGPPGRRPAQGDRGQGNDVELLCGARSGRLLRREPAAGRIHRESRRRVSAAQHERRRRRADALSRGSGFAQKKGPRERPLIGCGEDQRASTDTSVDPSAVPTPSRYCSMPR